jgi:hypothetical protein
MAQNTKVISSGGSYQTMESTLASSSDDGRERSSDGISAPVKNKSMVGATEATRNLHYFPSSASLNSSVWSLSGGSDSEGDSYAWSASLSSGSGSGSDSDNDYDSSDYSSSFSGASSGDEESDDEGPGQGKSRPNPIPMPPPGPPPPPMEGLDLSAIAHLKSELMKVGQAIIQSNVGQERAERAQTLASINWLSSHVPNAVLNHLGHEIRQMIEEEKGGVKDDGSTNKDKLATSVVNSEEMTEVSDLSDAYLNEMRYEHEAVADLTEVANMTATGYGDLANFAHAKASAFLPDMNIEPEKTDVPQSSAFLSIDEMTGVDTNGFVNRIPEAQPYSSRAMSLDDILQQGSEDPLVPVTHSFRYPQSKLAEDPPGHSSPSFGRPKRKEDPLGPSSHRMQSLNRSQKGSDDTLGNSTMHTSRSGLSFGGVQSLNRFQQGSDDPLGNNTMHTSRSSHNFGRIQSLSRSQKGSDDPLSNNTMHTFRNAIGGQRAGEERHGSNEGLTKRRGSMLGGPLAGPQDSNERRPPSHTRSGSGGSHESGEEERHPRARGVKGLFKRFVRRSKSEAAALRPTTANERPVAISRKKKPPVALQANPSLDLIRIMPTGSYDMTTPEAILPPGLEMHRESRKNPDNGKNPAESDFSQSLDGSSSDESEEKSQATSGNKDQGGKSKDKLKGTNLPPSEKYLCSLLFVDISGFTKLSTLLDPESLSRVSYWTEISPRGCLKVSDLPFAPFRQSILTFSLLLMKLWRVRVIY